jgi:hypothetical protein
MNTTQNQEAFLSKDKSLWRLAKKRAFFKQFAMIYIFISLLLTVLWYTRSGINNYFWPKWLMLSWGIAVVIQYINAYHGSKLFLKEKEYEKLKRQIN